MEPAESPDSQTAERAAVPRKKLSYDNLADILLLRSEKREDFERMRKNLEEEYRPSGFEDQMHFEIMLSAKWRLRRYQIAEAAMPSLAPKLKIFKQRLKGMFNGARKDMLAPRTRVY